MPYDIILGRDEEDRKKFGKKGIVYIGKSYVKMGEVTSLSNPVYLDVANPHVVLIAGKRGSGKCLSGDTLIPVEDGSVLPIKDLENDPRKILGLNNQLKIGTLEKSEFFKRKVNNLTRLKLRSGKEIKLTPEHPVLTIKGWKPINELSLGNRIATPRGTNLFGKCELENHKVKLLAYFLTEGHTMKSWVLFSNNDNQINLDFMESVSEFDPNLVVRYHSKNGCYRVCNENNRYTFRENGMKSWLKSLDCYGYYAPEKKIPQIIFNLPKSKIALFLNRLFSCDGSIYKNKSRNGWEIDYSSSSKEMIYQVHHLLLRFGILSKLRDKKIIYKENLLNSYEIVINSENTIKFINEIGFLGGKALKSKQCYEEIKDMIRNPNVDTIPKEIWSLYRPKSWAEVGRAFGYAHPKAMRERIKYSPSRQTLLRIADADNNTAIKTIAESDIFWDEIVLMEQLEGEFEVYDICVPNHHNFIANDIIVHNSYTASVISEEMARLPDEVKNNIGVLFFDTLGVFWTMKYPNMRQEQMLEKWGLQPEGLNVKIYTPQGMYEYYKKREIPTDYSFSIKTSELDSGDWCNVFEIGITSPIGVLIDRVVSELKGKEYSIDELISGITDKKVEDHVKTAATNLFMNAKAWGLFETLGTSISDLVQGGNVSVIDTSVYSSISGNVRIKALVIGLLCRKLLGERISARKVEEIQEIKGADSYLAEKKVQEKPLVWVILDEAHNYLLKDGKTPASDALVSLLREGRQPGISLILVTQQPGEISKDVLTQSDIVVCHRLTAKTDIEALNSMMQSYLYSSLSGYLNNLPKDKGSAIVLDDNSERIYPIKVHPKRSWHGGESPKAVKIEKKDELAGL